MSIGLLTSICMGFDFLVPAYGNENEQKILIKTVPDTFSHNGPKKGYVSIELTDLNGNPVRAKNNIPITLFTTNDIVNLRETELVIKAGEYFVFDEFEIDGIGNSAIHASAESLNTISSKITVTELAEPLILQLYVYPQTINGFYATNAYVIVQLQDANGNPVNAQEDINVLMEISAGDNINNTSSNNYLVTPNANLEIKKDSYYDFVKILATGGLADTYEVSISAQNYLISDPVELEVVNIEPVAIQTTQFDTLPILADGQEKLIGILHLKDSNDNPINTAKKIIIPIDSSDDTIVLTKNTLFNIGDNAVPVFGTAGYLDSDNLELRIMTGDNIEVKPELVGPTEDLLTLVAEPLITNVLVDSSFPLALYMENNGEISYFPENNEIFISPNSFIKVTPNVINKGESIVLLDSKSLLTGSTSLMVEVGNYETSVNLDNIFAELPIINTSSITSDPSITSDQSVTMANENYKILNINGFDPMPFVVIGMLGGFGILLKKKKRVL